MSELTPLVSAHHGVFFLADNENDMPILKLISSYAYKERKHVGNRFRLGEGLVGQCALEKKPILLQRVPGDYIQISSGLGEAPPVNIIVLPVLFEGEVKAVIELASFQAFSPIHVIFLEQLMESLGVVLNMITANMRTEELLQELKRSNAELEAQAKELEEKATLLEVKNKEVELASVSLEEKAEQLALISKYKSEFLANMSHELRTPLNSLMILARLLAENKEGNLSGKQVEFANTIYASGNDLLALINEILDLSKVESGKMAVDARRIPITEISEYVDRTFRQVAQQKNLTFGIHVDPGVPRTMFTDGQRLQQVLRNLLSNAFKFTDQGRVQLRVSQADRNLGFESDNLRESDQVLAFSVVDTGIGIPKDKQRMIFEAFQQADGTTSRKYGGTGLGLTISREIARLLGGEIRVESQPGRGSTFTLYLPARYLGPELPTTDDGGQDEDSGSVTPTAAPSMASLGFTPGAMPPTEQQTPYGAPSAFEAPALATGPIPGTVEFPDDRHHISPGDRVLLIVENDTGFARVLLGLAREKGLKGIVATDGDMALGLVSRYLPDAITLDLKLPGMDGWSVLDRLQRNPLTRHIPVHVISVIDRTSATQEAALGALTYLQKPVSREALDRTFASIASFGDKTVKNLLVVEDDPAQRNSIVELLDGGQIHTTAVSNGAEAIAALSEKTYDCMILDLGLPDMDGVELLEQLRAEEKLHRLPVIIYTSRDLTPDDETRLRKFSESIIVKDPSSTNRLVSETDRFMTRVQVRTTNGDGVAGPTDDPLTGKKVLVVDDDVRNIFALASVLESYGLSVLYAENGRDGIGMIRRHPDTDIVLMDIMMPEMDGYETMREIRQMPEFKDLPIISLTAKAMPGDREKCIEAGASDYIPKPVNIEQLIGLMRQWLGAAAQPTP